VRSHRQRANGSALGYRIGATLLVIAALAVGTLITRNIPDVDKQQRPFVHTAALGHLVQLRTFDATVLSVRGAAVVTDSDDEPHDTSGVWILVKVRLTTEHQAAAVGYAVLRDAQGHTYLASTRFSQFLVTGGWELQPGVPVAGEIAFEVPVAVATHLSIRLAASVLDHRMDDMADVPLPIDAGEVRQWKAQTTPVAPAKPAVVK
jgi:hypothetical protein